MMKKYILFVFLLVSIQNFGQKKTDIQKILDGIIAENKFSIQQNHLFIIRMSYFPNGVEDIFVDIYYYNKLYDLGWNDFDKNWGIYNYKGFEVFMISADSINLNKEVKNYKLITKDKFQNKTNEENGIIINYDPETWRFYADKNFKFVAPFFHSPNSEKMIKFEKEDFQKILKHTNIKYH